MTREELLSSPGYWTQEIQLRLFEEVNKYLATNHISRTAFAEQLGVSKGYISQILNGDFDHKLSKLVQISLACGLIPSISFIPKEKYERSATRAYTAPKWGFYNYTPALKTTQEMKLTSKYEVVDADSQIVKIA